MHIKISVAVCSAHHLYTAGVSNASNNRLSLITVSDRKECSYPKCKNRKIVFYTKVAKCSDASCGLIVFRNKSEKQLSNKQIIDLLATGKTAVIKCFKSKSDKSLDAAFMFDVDYKVVFD